MPLLPLHETPQEATTCVQIIEWNFLISNLIADKLGVSRSKYLSVESGQRDMSINEIKKVSEIYEIPIQKLISKIINKPEPVFNSDKFQSVLLYILEKTKLKNNVGKTVLFKLLYFSDFNFFQKYGAFLTGLTGLIRVQTRSYVQ